MLRKQFANSTILITGASGGIGRATALAFAEAGGQVIAHYNSREEEALETVQQAARAGGSAWAVQADLTNSEDIQKMVE